METSLSTLPSTTASPQEHTAPQQLQAPVQIRPLKREDARALHALICACPPLDVNSLYAYALLALHHSSTCLVAVRDGQLCGAVTGYIKPAQPDTYFLWQIAILPAQQGSGLGSALLDQVAESCLQQHNLQFLETTISPDNLASQRLFRRFAQRHHVACQQHPLFSADELQPLTLAQNTNSPPDVDAISIQAADSYQAEKHPVKTQQAESHEAEDLYRIGPW